MKKMLLTILVPLVAFCQTKDVSYLVVKGKAEVQVPVDYLEISLSITSNGGSLKAANDSNRVLVFKLLDTFRRFSIDDSDFQTTNNSAGVQDYLNDPTRRFAVQYYGTLFLRNPNAYDSLFQALVSLGNVSISISRFGSNQRPYYRMLAYQKAVEMARHEAAMLLKGTQQSVGKVIKLIQDNRDVFTQYDDIDKLIDGSQPSSIAAITVAPGQNANTFRRKHFTEPAEVTVIFAIK